MKNTYQTPILPKPDHQLELELKWPEFQKKCTCGAGITYGRDTILHSDWCDAYKDKYEKAINDTE